MVISRSMTVIVGANSQAFEFPPVKQPMGHHHHSPTIAFTALAGSAFVSVGKNLGLLATPDDSPVKAGETVYIPLPEGAGINHFAVMSADQNPAVLAVSVGRA